MNKSFVDIHNNTDFKLCKRQKFALRTMRHILQSALRSAGKGGAELFIRGIRAFRGTAGNMRHGV